MKKYRAPQIFIHFRHFLKLDFTHSNMSCYSSMLSCTPRRPTFVFEGIKDALFCTEVIGIVFWVTTWSWNASKINNMVSPNWNELRSKNWVSQSFRKKRRLGGKSFEVSQFQHRKPTSPSRSSPPVQLNSNDTPRNTAAAPPDTSKSLTNPPFTLTAY